jgi:hypothetical protein
LIGQDTGGEGGFAAGLGRFGLKQGHGARRTFISARGEDKCDRPLAAESLDLRPETVISRGDTNKGIWRRPSAKTAPASDLSAPRFIPSPISYYLFDIMLYFLLSPQLGRGNFQIFHKGSDGPTP